MTFDDVLEQALEMLRRRGRVSYRALKVQFQLDDDVLALLRDEIVEVHQLARDQEGTMLVWTGDTATGAPRLPPPPDQAPALLAYTPPYLAEKILTSRSARSCTPTLRLIPPIQKSDTMAPYDTIMRGHCDNSAPYLLSAGDCGTPVALRHAVIRALKTGQISESDALERLEPGRSWVWTALDPVSKLLLAMEVGPRTVEMAQWVVHQVVGVLAPGCVPAWFSDGFKGYLPAILGHWSWWVHPERRQDKGPVPKPRWMPLPCLLYAQVVKQYRRKGVVGVKHRVVFGTRETIESVLASCGWKINTSFVERLNLDIRQRVAAVGRRVTTLCQSADGMQHQLAVFHAYYNFVLVHVSLRQPWLAPKATNGSDSAKVWQPWTPAMAAGVTDHVWTLQERARERVASSGTQMIQVREDVPEYGKGRDGSCSGVIMRNLFL